MTWRQGRRGEEWHKGRHTEGLCGEALGGVKMKNKTVGMRFD